MNMDKLFDAVNERGNVCVGLDTSLDYIPMKQRVHSRSDSEAMLAFNKMIIDATIDICACYKVQIAYYEELGMEGLEVYATTLRYIRERGALVIADIKRGDITDTATRYAKAHFDGEFEADFVTLSPYMGMDTVDPWLTYVKSKGKGVFVLMRTSNQGMRDFEYQELANGGRLYDAVGDKLDKLAEKYRGECGYGAVGAVVGCTERDEAAEIRARRGSLFFLIPGYGAQGGGAADAALLLKDGNGGIVNASRSILKAWTTRDADFLGVEVEETMNPQAAKAARQATIDMRDAIKAACAGSPR